MMRLYVAVASMELWQGSYYNFHYSPFS